MFAGQFGILAAGDNRSVGITTGEAGCYNAYFLVEPSLVSSRIVRFHSVKPAPQEGGISSESTAVTQGMIIPVAARLLVRGRS